LTVDRAQLGSSNVNHTTLTAQVQNLGPYPQAGSIYFSFFGNSTNNAQCNGVGATNAVGCAVKLTQNGLK
jgi:hypothetical protein